MKTTSLAVSTALAGSQYFIANLYKITLVSQPGSPYYFTDSDFTIVANGITYNTGLTIDKGSFTQERGFKVQSLELTITPQVDNAQAVLFNGVSFLPAIRQALFDSAQTVWSKVIMAGGTVGNAGFLPTAAVGTPVTWFIGIVDEASAGRFSAKLHATSFSTLLSMSMPRNLLQPGCVHTLGDAGCTKVINVSPFTVTGTITAIVNTTTNNVLQSNLTAVDDYYSLGIITFTGGTSQNVGVSRTIRRYLNSSGTVQFVNPPPAVMAVGDTFSIQTGCDKSYATCSSRFANTTNFKGFPFVPVPESMYNGGVSNSAAGTPGGQGGGLAGSGPGSRQYNR